MFWRLGLVCTGYSIVISPGIYNSAQQTGFCDLSQRQVRGFGNTMCLLWVRACSGYPVYSSEQDRPQSQGLGRRRQTSPWWCGATATEKKETWKGVVSLVWKATWPDGMIGRWRWGPRSPASRGPDARGGQSSRCRQASASQCLRDPRLGGIDPGISG